MIGEIDGSQFAMEYARRKPEIERLSHTQRVPGLTQEEVAAELASALWKAFTTFDANQRTTLGQWWWVIWLREKSKLIEKFFKQSNPHPHLYDPQALQAICEEVAETLSPLVTFEDLCPGESADEKDVWWMLGMGYTLAEVMEALMMSRWRLRAVMDGWRHSGVFDLLSSSAVC